MTLVTWLDSSQAQVTNYWTCLARTCGRAIQCEPHDLTGLLTFDKHNFHRRVPFVCFFEKKKEKKKILWISWPTLSFATVLWDLRHLACIWLLWIPLVAAVKYKNPSCLHCFSQWTNSYIIAIPFLFVTDRDHCKPNPCLHGGNCTYKPGGFQCSCSSPNHGIICQLEAQGDMDSQEDDEGRIQKAEVVAGKPQRWFKYPVTWSDNLAWMCVVF